MNNSSVNNPFESWGGEIKFDCRNNVGSVCYWKKILNYFNNIKLFNTLMQMVISRDMQKCFVPFTDREKKCTKTPLLSHRDFSHLYELSSLEFTLYASDNRILILIIKFDISGLVEIVIVSSYFALETLRKLRRATLNSIMI